MKPDLRLPQIKTISDPNPNRVIVALSGGIDSTYLLKHLLESTELRLHVLAATVSTTWGSHLRREAEVNSAIRVAAHLYGIRPFKFDTIRLERYSGNITPLFMNDIVQLYNFMLPHAWGIGASAIYFGMCTDEHEHTPAEEMEFFTQQFAKDTNAKQMWSQQFAHKIGELYSNEYQVGWYPELRFTPSPVSKKESIRQLGHVVHMCHWCRTDDCGGTCQTCITVDELFQELEI